MWSRLTALVSSVDRCAEIRIKWTLKLWGLQQCNQLRQSLEEGCRKARLGVRASSTLPWIRLTFSVYPRELIYPLPTTTLLSYELHHSSLVSLPSIVRATPFISRFAPFFRTSYTIHFSFRSLLSYELHHSSLVSLNLREVESFSGGFTVSVPAILANSGYGFRGVNDAARWQNVYGHGKKENRSLQSTTTLCTLHLIDVPFISENW